jgi:hypothetical protein
MIPFRYSIFVLIPVIKVITTVKRLPIIIKYSMEFLIFQLPCIRVLSFIYRMITDRLCGLVVRVPGYRTEMYCVSCEVRPEFICYVEESRPPLWSSGHSSWLQNGDVLFPVRYEQNLYMLCGRE